MISMPPSVASAISAAAPLFVSSRPRTRRMLVALLVTLAVLFGGAGNGVSAQTAHFSGAGSMSTVGSGFSLPTGMVMDSSGNLYVADFMNNAVKEILAVNGSIPATPTIVTVGSGFSLPLGVAVDASGNVFVADGGAVKEVLAVDGSIPASPAIRTLAALSRPSGIAVDGNGNVFVSIGCVEASLAMSSASASADRLLSGHDKHADRRQQPAGTGS